MEKDYSKRITPDYITSLKPNEIFVFGSNLAGMHGGGAARMARLYFGAVLANGDGPLVGINAIVNGKGHAIRTGKGSGGGFGVQRVYRYSAGKADVAPDCYSTRR